MRILVIGAGMYVTGRHGSGSGTILAALAQTSREMQLEQVDIIARNSNNASAVKEAMARINLLIGTNLRVRYIAVTSVAEYLAADSNYDAAIVVVPDHLHYEIGKIVLERGIHCLMVKPLTPLVAEANDLVLIQQKRCLYAAVEFHKRFDDSNRIIKRLISDGTIGNVRYFIVNYSQRISIPLDVFSEWSAKSNIFQYLGVHYVDLVYFLTGARPYRAMAIGTSGVLDALGVPTFDSVHAIIQWRGDACGNNPFITVMNISWIDPRCTSALSDQGFTIVGSAGRVTVDQKNRGIELVKDGVGIQHLNPYFSDFLPTLDGGMEFQGYGYKSIRGFLDDLQALVAGRISLRELDANRPTFRQGLISTAVVEAVNKSLFHSSKWMDIYDIS